MPNRNGVVGPMIKARQPVKLMFQLRLVDGTLVESASATEPLCWHWGDGTLAPCLESLLHDAVVGLPQRYWLAAEQAFGLRQPEAQHTLPRADFAKLEPLAVGQIVSFTTPGGQTVAGQVQALTAAEVVVDFNHPLAGHNLQFEFTLLESR